MKGSLFFDNFPFPMPDINRPWEDLDDLEESLE